MRVSSVGTAFCSSMQTHNDFVLPLSRALVLYSITTKSSSILSSALLFVAVICLLSMFFFALTGSFAHPCVRAPSVTESSEIERTEFICGKCIFDVQTPIQCERWTILFFDFHIHFFIFFFVAVASVYSLEHEQHVFQRLLTAIMHLFDSLHS